MPFYIAKNYDGYIIGIVLAKNKEFAVTYWQGMELYPHSTSERREADIEDHITGAIPILKTKERNIGDFFKPNNIIVVNKG